MGQGDSHGTLGGQTGPWDNQAGRVRGGHQGNEVPNNLLFLGAGGHVGTPHHRPWGGSLRSEHESSCLNKQEIKH